MKNLIYAAIILMTFSVISCNKTTENIINSITANEITAKNRLDSAYAQARRNHSSSVQLALIFGKNVEFGGTTNGKIDISVYTGITNPDSLGAWLYFFKKPGTDSIFIYTPNPLPGASDCIELTALFNFNTLLNLISDTSARNIISGCLTNINNSNFHISTNVDSLVDSDVSMGYANSSNPVIKFDASFHPTASTENGGVFFTAGIGKSVNMFLIPALGTLNLPQFIQNLFGFPQDLWVVNYKKSDSVSVSDNLVIGTVVKSDQIMTIPIPISISSRAINLSKY